MMSILNFEYYDLFVYFNNINILTKYNSALLNMDKNYRNYEQNNERTLSQFSN